MSGATFTQEEDPPEEELPEEELPEEELPEEELPEAETTRGRNYPKWRCRKKRFLTGRDCTACSYR
ncbi:hypothetical protein PTW37_03750 [Arthrobacter agilis]|uniref:hypothetical protein n=1 Tax=Arthrobacter agilis TaxID=37921 RepID=UPI002365CD90|nr:hypothetical protein [Arthrobacter agilis]WDF34050.1 hypothetical protein PTW37_03750 [Arthrobacter agilis]